MRDGRLPTVPIIGVGGVRTGRDALELVAAGRQRRPGRDRDLQRPDRPGAGRSTSCETCSQDKGFDRFTDAVGVAHERMA